MHLSIAIPEAQVVDAPTLLKLIRMAPVCDAEADEEGAEYVASFEDFPTSVGIVARSRLASDGESAQGSGTPGGSGLVSEPAYQGGGRMSGRLRVEQAR